MASCKKQNQMNIIENYFGVSSTRKKEVLFMIKEQWIKISMQINLKYFIKK